MTTADTLADAAAAPTTIALQSALIDDVMQPNTPWIAPIWSTKFEARWWEVDYFNDDVCRNKLEQSVLIKWIVGVMTQLWRELAMKRQALNKTVHRIKSQHDANKTHL